MTSAWATSLDCKGTKWQDRFGQNNLETERKTIQTSRPRSDLDSVALPLPQIFNLVRFGYPLLILWIQDFGDWGLVGLDMIEVVLDEYVVTGFSCKTHCVFVRGIHLQIADCTSKMPHIHFSRSWAFNFQKCILIIDRYWCSLFPSESERANYSSVCSSDGAQGMLLPVVERTSALQTVRGFYSFKKHQQLQCWRNQHVQLAAGFLTAWRLWWRRG